MRKPSPYSARPGFTRRFSGQQPVAVALARVTRPWLAARGMASQRIVTDWPDIVGPSLAAMCQPRRIAFPKNGEGKGTLYIEVFYSGIAPTLEYMKEEIRERIAVFYGFQAVAAIRIIQSPVAPSSLQQRPAPFYREKAVDSPSSLPASTENALEKMEEGPLRQALYALAAHIGRE